MLSGWWIFRNHKALICVGQSPKVLYLPVSLCDLSGIPTAKLFMNLNCSLQITAEVGRKQNIQKQSVLTVLRAPIRGFYSLKLCSQDNCLEGTLWKKYFFNCCLYLETNEFLTEFHQTLLEDVESHVKNLFSIGVQKCTWKKDLKNVFVR